jgi:hypothetical protein
MLRRLATFLLLIVEISLAVAFYGGIALVFGPLAAFVVFLVFVALYALACGVVWVVRGSPTA